MSSSFFPVLSSKARMAGTGPIPMMVGSTPARKKSSAFIELQCIPVTGVQYLTSDAISSHSCQWLQIVLLACSLWGHNHTTSSIANALQCTMGGGLSYTKNHAIKNNWVYPQRHFQHPPFRLFWRQSEVFQAVQLWFGALDVHQYPWQPHLGKAKNTIWVVK